jgi:hypothetical protein
MPVYNYTTLDDPLQVRFHDRGRRHQRCGPDRRGMSTRSARRQYFESRANDSEELIMQTELKNSCDSPLLFQGK